MEGDAPNERVETGRFPFPILEGPEESQYLSWLRNHSNYMAARGLLDYLRAGSVLLRGILINFLIFLPYLLLLSLALAISRFLEQPPPFYFTKLLLPLFLASVLLFAVGTLIYRIARFRIARATGSDSSVKQRDWYERKFGAFLLVILGVAGLESLPGLLDVFHGDLGWPTLATTTVVATAVFSISPKLFSVLGDGFARTLAMAGVGALGLFIPLLVVLYVSDFLVFGPPSDLTIYLAVLVFGFPGIVVVAIAVGALMGAFKRSDLAGIALLLALSAGIILPTRYADIHVFQSYLKPAARLQDQAFARLRRDPESLDALARHVAERPGPALTRVSEDLRAPRDLRPGLDGELRLEALADAGEAAGLYPEFGEVVRALEARMAECKARGGPDCKASVREVQLLQAEVTTLRDVDRAYSQANADAKDPSPAALERARLGALATHVVSDEGIDSLIEGPGLYPLLCAEFPTTGECTPPFPAPHEMAGLARLADALVTLAEWGAEFELVRRELAATASISLLDSPFHATQEAQRVRENAFWPKIIFIALLAIQLWFFCWLTVDVNLTSIHGLYRDRLASAFLVGEDTEGEIDIEKDIDLMEICNHEEGSIAPYHLVNVALNLQGSKQIGVRDRRSDFFIFSKRFIGGKRTGYCRSETMERSFPQMDLATAMAISAGAAAPNMGRATSPALVAMMTLLNIRMGFWLPNPGKLESWVQDQERRGRKPEGGKPPGFSFDDVFRVELQEVQNRWAQLDNGSERRLATEDDGAILERTPRHNLVGIGFSGGGIRSAALNLGMTQALDKRGVFEHFDYMSTVSGGGYLGSSISTLMRRRKSSAPSVREPEPESSVGEVFRWRVRPVALVREILGKLDETSRWVNVSDGGHLENLAAIELLRRQCRYIILGDGEADPDHQFTGLATLIRTARIDLGVHIDMNVDEIRLNEEGISREHWAIGRIHYPNRSTYGHLLYLKSSFTGHEDVVIQQYRSKNPSFPHESTADQFFTEGQFEAYRSLGQHIAEQALECARSEGEMSFADLRQWFEDLDRQRPAAADETRAV